MPLILGLDTATRDTAVAVVETAGAAVVRAVGPDVRIPPVEGGRPTHGSALLGAIEAAVADAGGWPAIELIAVGLGPGSFTGLRIGIATARALAQSRRLAIAGVATSAALVAGIAASPAAKGRPPLAVLDAGRGEVFAATAEGSDADAVVCAPKELAATLGAGSVAGAVAGGEGSLRFRSEIESAGAVVLPESDPAHRISARWTCELAAEIRPVELGLIRPKYLRRPDAERWREQQRDGRN